MLNFFTTLDIVAILKIVAIDITLGLDNAIVIAMACAGLATQYRNKAMLFGTGGAIIARIVLLAFGFVLVSKFPIINLFAGAYLVWLAYSMLTGDEDDKQYDGGTTMFSAIKTIVLADVAMSIDNVVAVTAASESTPHSLEYAIFGIVLSIPIILGASKVISLILDKAPWIMWLGAALIAWVGAEMVLKVSFISHFIESQGIQYNPHIVIGIIMTIIPIAAAYVKVQHDKKSELQAG